MRIYVPSDRPARGAVQARMTISVAVCILLAAFVFASGTAAAASPWSNEIGNLEAAGSITAEQAADARTAHLDARKTRKRAKGASRRAISYVIKTADAITRSGSLSAGRVRPLTAILQRNADWFSSNGPAAAGTDRRFGDSRIIFQYFAGMGWQIHPLSNFAKLNAVWTDKSKPARRALGQYAKELIDFGVNRGGFLTWEYYFDFGGGEPPWTSGISQGTAVQALARSGNALNDGSITAAAKDAVGAFTADAPTGVRFASSDGPHFLIYSFNRRLMVLNGFLQALNGLRDYALIADDDAAYKLYLDALETARKQTPKSDTGAWSLYSVGGAESTLHYHLLLRDFLGNICDNNREQVFCGARDRFTAYTREQPKITKLKARQKGRRIVVRFRLSKISKVSVASSRGGTAAGGSAATVGYGVRVFTFKAPAKSGTYTISVSATDLSGNATRQATKVKVKKKR